MEFITLVASVFLVHGLSLISPGPDFFLVMRNSLLGSKALGRATAAGIIVGNIFYITLASGLSLCVAENIGTTAFIALKLSGGGYLCYLGFKILKTHFARNGTENPIHEHFLSTKRLQAFKVGLASMALNGKAAVYFVSMVPQFINPTHTLAENIFFFCEFILLSSFWFLGVASLSASSRSQNLLKRALPQINITIGFLLLGFGTCMLLEIMWKHS